MFARSTSILGDPDVMDAGIAYVRDEVMPMIIAMDGCVGLSMLVDPESGQCIVTSSWRSEDAMRRSDLSLAPARLRAGEVLRGVPQIEVWEVAVMHRDHTARAGSCCRASCLRVGHADIDRGIELYRQAMLPEMESLDGFCSASLLVNREAGRACSTTTYDSRAALEASRERSWAIRDVGIRDAGVDVLDVAEFDLVLAHLRLPELV